MQLFVACGFGGSEAGAVEFFFAAIGFAFFFVELLQFVGGVGDAFGDVEALVAVASFMPPDSPMNGEGAVDFAVADTNEFVTGEALDVF